MEIKTIIATIKDVIAAHPKRKPLDADGKFYGNPVPLEPPIGYKKTPSLHEQIRDMVRSEKLRQEVEAAGFETMDEADDFEVGDDYDPTSPYEYNFDPVHRAEVDRRFDERDALIEETPNNPGSRSSSSSSPVPGSQQTGEEGGASGAVTQEDRKSVV